MPAVPNYTHIESMLMNFIQISLCNISSMQGIYSNLKDMWQHKRDSNAPSACSESGGKKWQGLIRGLEYWLTALCLGYISNNARILNLLTLPPNGIPPEDIMYDSCSISPNHDLKQIAPANMENTEKDSPKSTSNYHNRQKTLVWIINGCLFDTKSLMKPKLIE